MEHQERLRLFLKSTGLKQGEFGKLLGYGDVMISKYLKGKKEINLDFLQRLIKAFPEVDLNYILKGEGEIFNPGVKNSDIGYGDDKEAIIKDLEQVIRKLKA